MQLLQPQEDSCVRSLLGSVSCFSLSCRIVLENSGVAEPQNIRDKMSEAEAEGHPVMDRVCLDTLVTVVRG